MNNGQKWDVLCAAMLKTYPVLASVFTQAPSRFGPGWADQAVPNIEAMYGPVSEPLSDRLINALDGYAEFANDSMRSQVFYERNGRYRASNYAEVLQECYHNEEHMTQRYLPGMWLTHYIWPQHYHMLKGFVGGLLPRLSDCKVFFEVGVGCGMYSKVLLEHFPDIRGIGFDISPYALQFTENLVRLFGHGDRYAIEQRDVRLGYSEPCDFLVCQEVLEHLENPEEFCRWLFDMIKPGGHGYITAALNAAHSDHIFHFRDPLQLEAMLRAAGFQPMSLQEEFAAGFKPREITPSLAGYLVERPR